MIYICDNWNLYRILTFCVAPYRLIILLEQAFRNKAKSVGTTTLQDLLILEGPCYGARLFFAEILIPLRFSVNYFTNSINKIRLRHANSDR